LGAQLRLRALFVSLKQCYASTMFRLGYAMLCRRQCAPSDAGPFFLTDEAGNRLLDPEGNQIVLG
jgi:hypothetical protein